MSNRRRIKRHAGRVSRVAVEAFGQVSAERRGCTCQPEYRVWHDDGITHCDVLHDDWCAVLSKADR